jgi:hypothetical protein
VFCFDLSAQNTSTLNRLSAAFPFAATDQTHQAEKLETNTVKNVFI